MTAVVLSFADAYAARHGADQDKRRSFHAALAAVMNRAELKRQGKLQDDDGEPAISPGPATSCTALAIAGADLAELPPPGPWSDPPPGR